MWQVVDSTPREPSGFMEGLWSGGMGNPGCFLEAAGSSWNEHLKQA